MGYIYRLKKAHATKHARLALFGIILLSTLPAVNAFVLGRDLGRDLGRTSVTIPGDVTNIEEYAFGSCTSLTNISVAAENPFFSSVGGVLFDKNQTTLIQYPQDRAGNYTIPNGVTNIGQAFSSCTKLTSITIPVSVTSIEGKAFAYCSSLTNVTMSNGVTSIGTGAFQECERLTSITIPGSVTNIGNGAFAYCSSLTNVTMSKGVTSIGNSAFHDCGCLTSITIPDSVTSIGNTAFCHCRLTSITASGNITYIGDHAFYGCSDLVTATIPNGVASIGERAFASCFRLTSVTIPRNCTSIGNAAFAECRSLTNLTIPGSVTSIGKGAFGGCVHLTSIAIPASVTMIEKSAFGTSLTNISVAAGNQFYSSLNGVLFDKRQSTLIRFSAGMSGSYAIPGSVTNIENTAFSGGKRLTSITIPDSVTGIGSNAFATYASLTNISVTAGNPFYSSRNGVLFDKRQTTVIRFPTGISGSYAIPAGVTGIASHAFSSCRSLTSVTIPDSVIAIGDHAFAKCNHLTNCTISGSVSSIGSHAFDDCSGLKSFTISKSVTNMGNNVFSGCSSLASINVAAGNPSYSSLNGILFDKHQTTLIWFPRAVYGYYTIPGSVTNIGSFAFERCHLTSVTIPGSVTKIESWAFAYCFHLRALFFMGDAPCEGDYVFMLDDHATVYYRRGFAGWDRSFGGRRTVCQNPPVGTPVCQPNQFAFGFSGTSNMVVVIEACTNLADPVWTPVSTNILTGGSDYFSDSHWTNYPSRFYRIRVPPQGKELRVLIEW